MVRGLWPIRERGSGIRKDPGGFASLLEPPLSFSFGEARLGLAGQGVARFGMVRQGLVRFGAYGH